MHFQDYVSKRLLINEYRHLNKLETVVISKLLNNCMYFTAADLHLTSLQLFHSLLFSHSVVQSFSHSEDKLRLKPLKHCAQLHHQSSHLFTYDLLSVWTAYLILPLLLLSARDVCIRWTALCHLRATCVGNYLPHNSHIRLGNYRRAKQVERHDPVVVSRFTTPQSKPVKQWPERATAASNSCTGDAWFGVNVRYRRRDEAVWDNVIIVGSSLASAGCITAFDYLKAILRLLNMIIPPLNIGSWKTHVCTVWFNIYSMYTVAINYCLTPDFSQCLPSFLEIRFFERCVYCFAAGIEMRCEMVMWKNKARLVMR